MFARVAKYVCWLFALVCVASIPFVLSAQVAPAVRELPRAISRPNGTSLRLQLPFASWNRGNRLNYTLTEPFSFVPVNGQEIFSVARYFKKHWGLELLGDIHLQNDFPNPLTMIRGTRSAAGRPA